MLPSRVASGNTRVRIVSRITEQCDAVTRFVGGVLLCAALGACTDHHESAQTDSLLMRDLTLAASPVAVTTAPTLGDTARGVSTSMPSPSVRGDRVPPGNPVSRNSKARPVAAPVAPSVSILPTSPPVPAPAATPAPTPSPTSGSGAGRRSIGSGATLVGKTDAQICSIANRPGDRFVATLTQEVIGPDGGRIAAGTPILVELAQPDERSNFAFLVKAVQVDGALIPVEGTVRAEGTTTDRRVSKGGDKGKVITGAIAGAILGRVLGGGARGTVIGAAGGAAAGTIAAARNSVTEHCLPAGATLTVTLSAPLVLTPGAP